MPLIYTPQGQLVSDWRTENAATAASKATATAAAPAPPRPTRPAVTRLPTREQFGTPSREGIDTTQTDMSRFLADYTNPRGTARFGNLLGAASSALARQADERTRMEQEASSRRGYTGGYSGTREQATRDAERERARIGFDAANTISGESAGLYDSAAGRYADLVRAFNEQQGMGDRAYGAAREDASNAHLASVERFRAAQEDARQYDTTLGENRRQYDTGLAEKSREFDVSEGGVNKRADADRAQRDKELTTTSTLERDRLAASQRESDRQWALDLARELGVDPRMILGRLGIRSGTVRPTATPNPNYRPTVIGGTSTGYR